MFRSPKIQVCVLTADGSLSHLRPHLLHFLYFTFLEERFYLLATLDRILLHYSEGTFEGIPAPDGLTLYPQGLYSSFVESFLTLRILAIDLWLSFMYLLEFTGRQVSCNVGNC